MSLQITKETGTVYNPVFQNIIEDIPGGISFTVADLKALTEEVKAGAVIGEDGSTAGKYHLIKTAAMQAAAVAGAVELKVEKNHEFVVGDFITNGQVSTAITIITTPETLYDTITITATLDAVEPVPIDTVLYQGVSETSNAAVASLATLEDTAADYLAISAPRGNANDIICTINQNGSDALAVTYTPSTKILLLRLAGTTAASNNAATIQTAIRALAQDGGVDFTDWTVVGTGWDGGQTGATLTDPSHRMEDGVEKPANLAPLYDAIALIRDNIDVTDTEANVSVGAITKGTVVESILPFSVTDEMKTLLPGIRFA